MNYAYARALKALWEETGHTYEKNIVQVPAYDHAHSLGVVIKSEDGEVLGALGICGPIASACKKIAADVVRKTPGLEQSISVDQ